MNALSKRICFSITATGRCNRGCTYCHFYAGRDRAEFEVDICDDLFNRYVDLIKYTVDLGYDITVRLSGGEPLVIENDRMFQMCDYLYKQTGIKPFVMTNGRLLSEEVLEKAKESHISSFVVSCENPFDQSPGAEPTEAVLDRFRNLNNKEVPLYPGMIVIDNAQFGNIKKIADYFWHELGFVPPMCEKNFLVYERPTDSQIEALKKAVTELVREYNGKSDICLFPYIIPELYSGNLEQEQYLVELALYDERNYMDVSNEDALKLVYDQIAQSMIKHDCPNIDCELHDYCKEIKWVWFSETAETSESQKLEDYCKLKQALTDAFFNALCENEPITHGRTTREKQI